MTTNGEAPKAMAMVPIDDICSDNPDSAGTFQGVGLISVARARWLSTKSMRTRMRR